MPKLTNDKPSHCEVISESIGKLEVPKDLNGRSWGLGPLISALNLENDKPVTCDVDADSGRITFSTWFGSKGAGQFEAWMAPGGKVILSDFEEHKKIVDPNVTPDKYFKLIQSLGDNKQFMTSLFQRSSILEILDIDYELYKKVKEWSAETRNALLKDEINDLKSDIKARNGFEVSIEGHDIHSPLKEITPFNGDQLNALTELKNQLDDRPQSYYRRINIEKIVLSGSFEDEHSEHQKEGSKITTQGLKQGETVYLAENYFDSKVLPHETCHIGQNIFNVGFQLDVLTSAHDYQKYQYPDLSQAELAEKYNSEKYFIEGLVFEDGERQIPAGQPSTYATTSPEESLCETKGILQGTYALDLINRAKSDKYLANAIDWAKMELYVESGGQLDQKFWNDVDNGEFIDKAYWSERLENNDFEMLTGPFNYKDELLYFNTARSIYLALENKDFTQSAKELKQLNELVSSKGMEHRESSLEVINHEHINVQERSVRGLIAKGKITQAHKQAKLARKLIKTLNIRSHGPTYHRLGRLVNEAYHNKRLKDEAAGR